MVDRTFYGYAPGALSIDPVTGDVRLEDGYSPASGRSRFEVSDNDNFADGDSRNDEIGDDSNQTASVTGPDGSLLGAGRIYVEEVRWYETSDGDAFTVTVFEIDGEVMGFVPSQPLEPGQTYTYTGATDAGEKVSGQGNNNSQNNYTFYERNSVPCFGPGTMIATQNGEIPVEWLDTSDMVLTRDNGFQPILWIGRSRMPRGYFRQYPDEIPIELPVGALGRGCPSHPLRLTGDHRVLIRAPQAELLFFCDEVLAPAKAWADAGRAQRTDPDGQIVLTHILLAQHHAIMAEGAWVESMFPGKETLRRVGADVVATLEALLGPDMYTLQTARPSLTRKEAVFLLSQLPPPPAQSYAEMRPRKEA